MKAAVLLLVFGYILDFIGGWMKITHQAFADEILTAAALIKIIGLLIFTFKLFAHPKIKEFLEYDKVSDSFK